MLRLSSPPLPPGKWERIGRRSISFPRQKAPAPPLFLSLSDSLHQDQIDDESLSFDLVNFDQFPIFFIIYLRRDSMKIIELLQGAYNNKI